MNIETIRHEALLLPLQESGRSGMPFMPDINMRQNVGQRKDVARPTSLTLNQVVIYYEY